MKKPLTRREIEWVRKRNQEIQDSGRAGIDDTVLMPRLLATIDFLSGALDEIATLLQERPLLRGRHDEEILAVPVMYLERILKRIAKTAAKEAT